MGLEMLSTRCTVRRCCNVGLELRMWSDQVRNVRRGVIASRNRVNQAEETTKVMHPE